LMASGYALEMETIASCCCNGPELLGRPLIVADVGGGGAFTVIDTVARDTSGFGVDESVTENVIEVVPTGAVVVPNSIQVVVLFVVLVDGIQVLGSGRSPRGNVPMAQVYGPTPPLTVPSDCETTVPSVSVRGEDVMFSKPATAIVSCCCVVTGGGTEPTDAGV
jgi:hypothetical protein